MEMSQASVLAPPVKHRACDECRTRKLACSKEPGGCERCRRENHGCHYSEQKPMGRPRKRQFIETEPNHFEEDGLPDSAPELYVVNDTDAYKSTETLNAFLLNGLSQPGFPGVDSASVSANGTPYSSWQFGGSMVAQPIDFGDHASGRSHSPSIGSAPQLSAGSASDSPSSPPQPAVVPCGCLASMYLSLASLQQFPTDIVDALKTVRVAAHVAAASIWCPQCGLVTVDAENPDPPIDLFQNTMLLGTILPIIANGYQRLLRMIDDETNLAEMRGQTKTFRFSDYGGMCRQQDKFEETMDCVTKQLLFSSVEMPPHQWRTTIRALLRIDIYGHEAGDFQHKGLKNLVTEMEFRQRVRHDFLNARDHAGLPGHGVFKQSCKDTESAKGLPDSTYTCLQILNIAKLAIDNLLIA